MNAKAERSPRTRSLGILRKVLSRSRSSTSRVSTEETFMLVYADRTDIAFSFPSSLPSPLRGAFDELSRAKERLREDDRPGRVPAFARGLSSLARRGGRRGGAG